MTDKPDHDEKARDEAFQRTLENMLKLPHKPHRPVRGQKSRKGESPEK